MKESRRINLWLLISAITLGGTLLAALIGALTARFLNIDTGSLALLWILLAVGLVIALVMTVVTRMILLPITRLGTAMQRVADGDFSVSLECGRNIGEVVDIYHNFNLMVRQLGATETLQSDFISNVSHEFKTPINAIEGYAMLLQGAPAGEAEECIDKILFNTRRLSDLVGSILLLSKVQNHALPLKKSRYRLDEQIRQSIVLLEPDWSKKETEFDVSLDEIHINANEALMLHVWNNLIGNAIKFGPERGLVRMRLRRDAGKIIFTIEDSGPGILEEEQALIFGKFYQGDTSHKSEGNGLGLALVKRILLIENGEIKVENLADCGCRFTVTLPEA